MPAAWHAICHAVSARAYAAERAESLYVIVRELCDCCICMRWTKHVQLVAAVQPCSPESTMTAQRFAAAAAAGRSAPPTAISCQMLELCLTRASGFRGRCARRWAC